MGAAAALMGGAAASGTASAATTAHDLQFETVINAVSDAGMDPTGATPIDNQLQSVLGSNTLIQFPSGEYLLTDEHILTGVSNIGIQGLGDSPSDVRFVFPDGNSGAPDPSDFVMFWIETDSGLLLENFEVHQTDDRQTGASIVATADDALELHDIRWQGFNPSRAEANEGCLYPSVTSSEGTGHVTNITIDGGGVIDHYPGRRTGIALQGVHIGDLTLQNLDVRELGAPAVRATDCSGTVNLLDSYFENNDHGSVHVGGGRDGNTSIERCKVVVDASRIQHLKDGEQYENVDGIRIDAGGQGWSGAVIEDCELLFNSFPSNASGRGAIIRPTIGNHGTFDVRNSTIRMDVPDCTPVHVASPGSNVGVPTGATLTNVHITGTQASNSTNSVVFISESDGSSVSDCCISFPNGLNGVHIQDSENCAVVDSDIAVDGNATSFSESSVHTQNLTSTGACRVLSSDDESDSSNDGSDGTDSTGDDSDGTDSDTDGSDGSDSDPSDGSDGSEQLKRIAVKSKGTGKSRFTLSASDSLRAASDADGTVKDRTVSDRVGPKSDVDSYYYTGHITSFSMKGAEHAEVYFADPDTGEKLRTVDPAILDGNALTMRSTGCPTTYDLSVTGTIEPDAGALEDTVNESSASGQITGESDVDTFYFIGHVTEMDINGTASITFERDNTGK